MYLKELTINGFKSFARKSELEFSTAITAIVGPNGSGKSNVAESFRFVLGEQSIKSLRGARGEDLIWGGSEQVARGNRAAVQVVFDNTQRTFDVDFDEVRLERVVHRDGQNEYKLNGSTVRLKDITELLAQAHIGATGHHIISQGEADRVLSAGAKERREMIEDALGLKVYQLKKQEAERKLAKTEENILQVESLRREAAPHLRYLKKQVEQAERALQVQRELRTAMATYLKREDVYLARRTDQLTAEREQPQRELSELADKLTAVKTLLDTFETRPVSSALAETETAYQEASRERVRLVQEQSRLEGQKQFIEARLAKPVVKASTAISRAALETLVASLAADRDRLQTEQDATVLVRALSAMVEKLQTFLHSDDEVVKIDTNEADMTALAELEASLEAAAAAVVHATEHEQNAQAAVTAERAAATTTSEEARMAERDMFALMNQRRELETTVRKIDQELVVLERDRDDFKRELQEAVALLGRGATEYFTHQILSAEGTALTDEAIMTESRSAQQDRRRDLEKLKIRLEELGVGATEDLLKEYEDAQARDAFLQTELQDLQQSVTNLNGLISDMDVQLHEQFAAGLQLITKEFNTFFTLMFGGGSAKLERVALKTRGDDEAAEPNPTAEGVELAVALPNKRVKGLEMLSGGERALTSIALIFAMSQVNPPPFIILDETDAALDEANSRRYGDMIEALAKKSQLILITHNRETMSRAGILYGITMGADGASKVLSVKFDEAAAVAK